MGSAADWTLWIAGGLIALAALVLLRWALFGDRGKSFRRCPKCWHDMTGTTAMTCSECRRAVRRERAFFRRRRRWRWAFLAVALGVLATAGLFAPRVRRDGWTTIIPTTALIIAIPWLEDPFDAGCEIVAAANGRRGFFPVEPLQRLRYEVHERLERGPLWGWQQRLFVSRCAGAFDDLAPNTHAWCHEIAPLIGVAEDNLSDPSLTIARRLCLVSVLKTRVVWPERTPLYVMFDTRYHLQGWGLSKHVRLNTIGTLHFEGSEPVNDWQWSMPTSGTLRRPENIAWKDGMQRIGIPPAGTEALPVTVHIADHPGIGYLRPLLTARRGTIDDVMTGLRHSEAERALAGLEWTVTWHENHDRLTFLDRTAVRTALAPLARERATFAVTIEALDEDGVVLATCAAWWPATQLDDPGYEFRFAHYHVLKETAPAPLASNAPIVAIRLRGNKELALRDFESTRCWVGEGVLRNRR